MAAATFFGVAKEACIGNKKDRIAGKYPSVAANSKGDVVCIYNGWVRSQVYCGVGKLGNNTVEWSSTASVCAGSYPRVAINDERQVVITYSSGSAIKYRIGHLNAVVEWKSEHDVLEGENPSIAMSGRRILLVYQASRGIHYCFGSIADDCETILWKETMKGAHLSTNAYYPSVSMNDSLAVVIFNNGSRNASLLTKVGVFDRNGVEWGEVQDDYEDNSESEFFGDYPCITLLKNSTVVSTFQRGRVAARTLHGRCGRVQRDAKRIVWQEKPGGFVHGCYSSLSGIDEEQFVEMHSTNGFGWSGIWLQVGKAN